MIIRRKMKLPSALLQFLAPIWFFYRLGQLKIHKKIKNPSVSQQHVHLFTEAIQTLIQVLWEILHRQNSALNRLLGTFLGLGHGEPGLAWTPTGTGRINDWDPLFCFKDAPTQVSPPIFLGPTFLKLSHNENAPNRLKWIESQIFAYFFVPKRSVAQSQSSCTKVHKVHKDCGFQKDNHPVIGRPRKCSSTLFFVLQLFGWCTMLNLRVYSCTMHLPEGLQNNCVSIYDGLKATIKRPCFYIQCPIRAAYSLVSQRCGCIMGSLEASGHSPGR